MLGIIFDWDGVVIDSSRHHEKSWDLLAAEEGLPLFEGHFKQGFGKRNELIIRTLLKWSDDPREIDRLGDRKEVLYREIVQSEGIELLPGVAKFLDALHSQEIPFAVGSSTPRENIEAVLAHLGNEGLFPEIVAAADVTRGKPDPEVFLKAAHRIGIPPGRCVVFEDSLSGIEAGLAGGMTVVALTTTNCRRILEKTGAALIASGFPELSVSIVRGLAGKTSN